MITVKHEMDEAPRTMSLDDVFLEALTLSESESNKTEEKEAALLRYLNEYPEAIHNITEKYKRDVMRGWDYEIIDENNADNFLVSPREIALSKRLRKPPKKLKKGFKQNLYEVDGVTYAVFTEQESFEEVLTYFQEDLSQYHFSLEFMTHITNISEDEIKQRVEFDDYGENNGSPAFRKFIYETVGMIQLVRECINHNGGYGYYINQADHSQHVQGDFIIYQWN